jgi:ABC-type transporter Mla subunit MlaD
MLEERSRLLETLQTLLDAVNHASTEQRTAIDALVTTSAELLDRVGTRFTDHIEAETGRLGDAASQVSAGAVEVASLGDAFGAAVQQFGDWNDRLVERLQGVETALDKSLARSDEQLAYYVAQAREVIDLSMLAQRQIIEDLQQLAGRRADAETEAA